MLFNATFNNISVISWRSVLLVEETVIPGETHQPATIPVSYKLYYIMWYGEYFARSEIRTHNLVVIGIDYTCSCKSNYHQLLSKQRRSPETGNLWQWRKYNKTKIFMESRGNPAIYCESIWCPINTQYCFIWFQQGFSTYCPIYFKFWYTCLKV